MNNTIWKVPGEYMVEDTQTAQVMRLSDRKIFTCTYDQKTNMWSSGKVKIFHDPELMLFSNAKLH